MCYVSNGALLRLFLHLPEFGSRSVAFNLVVLVLRLCFPSSKRSIRGNLQLGRIAIRVVSSVLQCGHRCCAFLLLLGGIFACDDDQPATFSFNKEMRYLIACAALPSHALFEYALLVVGTSWPPVRVSSLAQPALQTSWPLSIAAASGNDTIQRTLYQLAHARYYS